MGKRTGFLGGFLVQNGRDEFVNEGENRNSYDRWYQGEERFFWG